MQATARMASVGSSAFPARRLLIRKVNIRYPLTMNEAVKSLAWLRYPAYGLFHLNSLAESACGGYLYDIVPDFRTRFEPAQQQSILEALAWAANAADLDWEQVLPGLPHPSDFKQQHCRITRDRLLDQLKE